MPLASLLKRRRAPVPFRPATLPPGVLRAVAESAHPLPAPAGPEVVVRSLVPRAAAAVLRAGQDADAPILALVESAAALFGVAAAEDHPEGSARCHMAAAQMALFAEEAGLEAAAIPLRAPLLARLDGDATPGGGFHVLLALGPGSGLQQDAGALPGPAAAPGDGQAAVLLSLLEIAAATNASEDLDRLLESIASELGRLVPVDRADAAFVEDGVMHAAIIVPRDPAGRRTAVERLPVDDSHHLGYVLGSGRPLWRNDLGTELRFRETLPRGGMRSDMTIPLRARGQVTGALRVACRRRHAYEPEEFEVLSRLADVMAMAVENQRLLQVTRRMAEVDGLTGVCNRRHFQALLARETERALASGEPLSLVLADVDHFKQVNDRHGHPAGDSALQHVARILSRRPRRSDVVARYGGEEFAVLLPGTGAEVAKGLAEELRREIETAPAPIVPGAPPVTVTASFGVATLPDHAGREADLVAAADRALYRAKQAGRNRVEVAVSAQTETPR
jgi:diguanylate cyclase (GGDEF)-like protein